MNSFITNALGFRSKRKCFSMAGCLIFVLLMSQASCRPSEIENESDDTPTYNDGDYTDVDDIEWQNFPTVETTTKFHPAIYYKEDFVSEDYDPNKEKKSSSTESDVDIKVKPRPRRKYKEISRRNRVNRNETYRLIKPEKVFFDILPTEEDGIKDEDAKFNEDVRIELVSLLDDEDDGESKHRLLSKRPKKYPHRHRERRDVKTAPSEETDEAAKHTLRHKRNPYFRYSFYGNQLPQYRGVFYQPQVVIYPVNRIKHPVKTHYINAVSPGGGGARPGKRVTTTVAPSTTAMPDLSNRFGEPVWNVFPASTTQRPQTTSRPSRRPPPPLIHSGDEDYVPSESASQNRPSRPSESGFQGEAAFRPVVPEEVYEAPPVIPQTTTAPPPPPANSRGVSACIWAISSCCTRNEKIRYQCFERLGCSGAFWDLNPCADDIFRLAVEAADQYFN